MWSFRRCAIVFVATAAVLMVLSRSNAPVFSRVPSGIYRVSVNEDSPGSQWIYRKENYPVSEHLPLPKPGSSKLPAVQHRFSARESVTDAALRKERQLKVKTAMQRCWESYRERAWLRDELTPISGSGRDPFGGWAATLVDSLDTLWIMDLRDEFEQAVDAAMQIDFGKTSQDTINVFETTIRYLGGFLAAYDLSGDKRLLDKSLQLAHMLYAAFDTPNRMPITRWDIHHAAAGGTQVAPDGVLVAEIGSLTLEFTRLSQITHDPKWYDAVARIMVIFDQQQNASSLPGMWPMVVNARDQDFHSGDLFTLGAMSDSMYEYLPKMYALLGGSDLYERLYRRSMEPATQHALFRPMTPENADILMAGPVTAKEGHVTTQPEGQHLVCFVGGMLALGGRLIREDSHVELGRKVTDGCIWAYDSAPLGIMPETYSVVACENSSSSECRWDEVKWHAGVKQRVHSEEANKNAADIARDKRLPPGFTSMPDRRYILRPEAIESVFILYRVTGDRALQDTAWRMFSNIYKYTETEYANAALNDVTNPSAPKSDSMESFWTAETLKYFYLVFSSPDLISLDEYVFNTEAHPLKRPSSNSWFR